jgi:hypothetical protein
MLRAWVDVVVSSERQRGSFCNRERIEAVDVLLGCADWTEEGVEEVWSVVFPVLDGRPEGGGSLLMCEGG